jgi:hypothetical protein
MDLDPELGWPCPWVKVTQLLGAEHCYLVTGHDDPHLFKGYVATSAVRGVRDAAAAAVPLPARTDK